MVVKVYISGISGNKEVKKRQQRVQMILDGKSIEYEVIDIAEPGRESDKEFVQENAVAKGAKHPLPPQIFNGDTYCGDYEDFDSANELDELEKFLRVECGSSNKNGGIANGVNENGNNKPNEEAEVFENIEASNALKGDENSPPSRQQKRSSPDILDETFTSQESGSDVKNSNEVNKPDEESTNHGTNKSENKICKNSSQTERNSSVITKTEADRSDIRENTLENDENSIEIKDKNSSSEIVEENSSNVEGRNNTEIKNSSIKPDEKEPSVENNEVETRNETSDSEELESESEENNSESNEEL